MQPLQGLLLVCSTLMLWQELGRKMCWEEKTAENPSHSIEDLFPFLSLAISLCYIRVLQRVHGK